MGWPVVCALVAGGCVDPDKTQPPKHRLEGSLFQVMDLGWDTARIAVSLTDMSLTFVRKKKFTTLLPDGGVAADAGVSEDYPLIVAYRFDLDEAPPGKAKVDLAAKDAESNPKGVATRNVQNDPRTNLPKIRLGELYLDRFPEPEATVRGDLHITFENGIEAASGHTVFGDFEAKVAP